MKSTIMKMSLLTLFIVALVLLNSSDLVAQCPMCKLSAETNLKGGGTAATGLNKGIIYLLMIPYILMTSVGLLWWRNHKLFKAEELEREIIALLVPA